MARKRLDVQVGILLVGIAIGYFVAQIGANGPEKRDAEGRLLGYYNNLSRARAIKPGTALSKVITALGDPIGCEDGWLVFVPSPEGRAPRMKIGATGLVAETAPGD